ncbi:biotin/lipoyl-binding protein, partial [Azorhizobium sp. AG788]|uniref:HlyD family secretion protein n=1 Tax=Azorhizobium sp. AG788 TaxID=2183897 RepID=UPI0031394EC1
MTVAAKPSPNLVPMEPRPDGAAASPVSDLPKKGGLRRVLVIGGLAVVIAGAAVWGYRFWTVGRFMVSTDNAYVGADVAIVAPKVSGYVAAAPLVANSHVKAGDVLVRLDDSDYRVAVRQASAKVDTQDSTIARLGKQVDAQAATIDQTKAQLLSAAADEARAAADFNRTAKLANSAFASQQSLDSARADRDKTSAATVAAKAAVASAEGTL